MNSERDTRTLKIGELFTIFLKAGFAFGGGLGILSVLENELVTRRKLVTPDEFLTYYGIGRVVPSGTMTALAVAYGYRFGGWLGTVVALTALVLPTFVITILLTIAYQYLKGSELLTLLPATLLPAALALIVAAAISLGKNVFKPSLDLIVAALALTGALFLNISPSILLVAGGIFGMLVFGRMAKDEA